MNVASHPAATETGHRGDPALPLDSDYNNAAAVVDSAAITAAWAQRGESARKRINAHLSWSYGSAPRQSIDVFPGTDATLPLVVFFHGGYWQSRAKEDFSFVAEGPLACGFSVALVGYTLAPENTVAGIVQECREALAFLHRSPGVGASALLLAGWSAGAHLVACLMKEPGVMGGLAISGVYDLEPLRHTYLNTALHLDNATAMACSPIHHLSDSTAPLTVAWGRNELPALQQQSERYAQARAWRGLATRAMPIAGANHFSILDALASPHGVLAQELLHIAREHPCHAAPSPRLP